MSNNIINNINEHFNHVNYSRKFVYDKENETNIFSEDAGFHNAAFSIRDFENSYRKSILNTSVK